MNMFACIPEAPLVSILMDWLSLKDFGRLDSAICNRKYRAELLRLVSDSQHAFSEEWGIYSKPCMQWMMQRGVKCRAVRLWQHLVEYPLVQEEFLIHCGRALQFVHVDLEKRKRDDSGELHNTLEAFLHVLSLHCLGLKDIEIGGSRDKSLSDSDFLSLHLLIEKHPALYTLSLQGIERVPLSLLLLALSKLKFVSLQSCTVVEDVPFVALSERVAIFHSINTPLPLALCAYVSDATLNALHGSTDVDMKPLVASYTNLSAVALNNRDIIVDTNFTLLIAQHWQQLVYLRFNTTLVDEKVVVLLVKHLPTLRVFDAAGEGEIGKPNRDVNSTISQLHAISLYCNETSTLVELLQLCPHLATLSLLQPDRQKGDIVTYTSVEKSLHLIRDTSVRHLYLYDYTSLCNEDVAALQGTQLHTLSICEASRRLNDKTILTLIPTLPCLHTLDLSCCDGLTYNLVLKIPPLCPTLRKYTYNKTQNRCCGGDSASCFVFDEVLPKIFPHVKEFCINC